MISYELAAKLKQAGFPQKGASFWYDEDQKLCMGGEHRMGKTFFPKKTDGEYYTTITRLPTIGELIDSFGIKFISLSLNPLPKNIKETWVAVGAHLTTQGYSIQCGGEFPEEALANLYLRFNK